MSAMKTIREIAKEIGQEGAQCSCDFDNWEPEADTGHSCVCRIHKEAHLRFRNQRSVDVSPVTRFQIASALRAASK